MEVKKRPYLSRVYEMAIRTKTTNVYLYALIKELRKVSRENNAKIWKTVAKLLERPKRNRVVVNLYKINRLTKSNDVAVIPGKVLGIGEIDHPVKVAALAFSERAKNKITNAGGEVKRIEDLIRENPQGSGIKIII